MSDLAVIDKARFAHRVKVLTELGLVAGASLEKTNAAIRLAADPDKENDKLANLIATEPRKIIELRKFAEDDYIQEIIDLDLVDLHEAWEQNSRAALVEEDPDQADRLFQQWAEKEEARAEEDEKRAATGRWSGFQDSNYITANALYDKAREAFLMGDLAWDSADIRVILVDTGLYTVNLGTHDFLDDIPTGAARVATSAAGLANKTGTAGVADADDITLSLVSGNSIEAVVLYDHTGGSEAVRRLCSFLDTGTGLPVTPSGSDIAVAWDSGANRIFKL